MDRTEMETDVIAHEPVIAANGSKASHLGRIVYTRTRPVQVSPALLRRNRLVAAGDDGPSTDAYKMLRTQVMFRMREHGWKVLGVTSPRRQEGKTLTAINLGISIALDVNQTVLLVDADLRQPRVHQAFGLRDEPGLAAYLAGDTLFEDALVHPGIPRFLVLPGGHGIPHSVELLTSPRMLALVEELRQRYASRLVIVDLPPVLDVPDTLAFSPSLDALLVVVEAGRTQADDVQRSLRLLQGTPVLGTVLNKG